MILNPPAVQWVGTDMSTVQLPKPEALASYSIAVIFSEHQKVTAIADAALMQQVKNKWRLFPTTILNERIRMINGVMGQVTGIVDEVTQSKSLEENINKGRDILDEFNKMFKGGKQPEAVRYKATDLAAIVKKNTNEYVDLPVPTQ
jgi:hypothetical protein